ncbi:MAG: type IV secretion protein IcmD [Legionellales bacterium]|nr:type IV secretion protein IcmD [Legionellales bacterium]
MMKHILKRAWHNTSLRVVKIISSLSAIAFTCNVRAADTIGKLAANVTSTFGDVAKLITAASYVGGIGFAVGAILKFKQHKDNPTQIPIGTPIAMLGVAAALLFLPTILGTAGETIFGGSQTQGTVGGVDTF